MSSSSISLTIFLFLSLPILYFQITKAQSVPPLIDDQGLSFAFYDSTCPDLESIVRDQLRDALVDNIGLAAGLLRLHFHDCFVKGCVASVLLVGSENEPSEQQALPNLTLRPEAIAIVDEIRTRVQKRCGRIVSCADILTLAARDSVYLSGGPDYPVRLGRRDSLTFATINETIDNLPFPNFTISRVLPFFTRKNLDVVDLVALSGGHTIGRSHCSSFINRIYPTLDPTMDKVYAHNLKEQVCPQSNSTNVTYMDIRTPNKFDNKYYIDLINRQGLFTSDQDLYTDNRTRDIVKRFAVDQDLFLGKFVDAMIRMGQLHVLTGEEGEIRANCSVTNGNGNFNNQLLSSMVHQSKRFIRN